MSEFDSTRTGKFCSIYIAFLFPITDLNEDGKHYSSDRFICTHQ